MNALASKQKIGTASAHRRNRRLERRQVVQLHVQEVRHFRQADRLAAERVQDQADVGDALGAESDFESLLARAALALWRERSLEPLSAESLVVLLGGQSESEES